MWKVHVSAVVMVLVLAGHALWADDLTGSSRFLCSAVQVSACTADGECKVDQPRALNVPQFIEVDLDAKRLNSTAASGENRATPIQYVTRHEGTVVLQGFEMGRAFSFVITEQTGRVTVAVATQDGAVSIFGACTPITGTAEPTGR